MADPVNYLAPDQRRRMSNRLMAEQFDTNYPVRAPDDTFLNPHRLSQGPAPMPRNAVADELRERGYPTYADRFNSMSYGPGLLTDAVAGIANAAVVEPVAAWNRMIDAASQGERISPEDSFNVAGAAMVGGLASPKPRMQARSAANTAANPQFEAIGFHGAADNSLITQGARDRLPGEFSGPGGPWLSTSPDVASTYSIYDSVGRPGTSPTLVPAHVKFNNPMFWDAQGREGGEAMVNGRIAYDTNDLSREAAKRGHDGLVVRNVRDEADGGGAVSDVLHPISRGTVFSPFTGDLLYANGGSQGAATGTALNSLLSSMQRPSGEAGFVVPTRMPERTTYRGFHGSRDGDALRGDEVPWGSSRPDVAADYALDHPLGAPSTTPDGAMTIPVEYRFANPMVVDAQGKHFSDLRHPNNPRRRVDTDDLANIAQDAGHDGLVVNNVLDMLSHEGGPPATTYAPLRTGTVYSPLTGDLLYANGGRQGAAAGTAVNALTNGAQPHPWSTLDTPRAPSRFPHGVKREWAPGGERVEIYTPETQPYPVGGLKYPRLSGFTDEPLASDTVKLKPRSDGSGELVWPFTEAEEALVKRFGARAAPDLYANGGPSGPALNLLAQYYGQPERKPHWSDTMRPGDI